MILCLETMFVAEECPTSLANSQREVGTDEYGRMDLGFLFPVFPQCRATEKKRDPTPRALGLEQACWVPL